MGIYASRPRQRAAQVASDLLMVVWTVGWAVAGVFIRYGVSLLAVPAREASRTASRLATDLDNAARQAGQVPGLGGELRRPFDAAAASLGSVVAAADHQVAVVERLALIAGWLAFLLPVAIVVALWLPRRIRFARQARAAQALLDAGYGLDLFALRALATQPMPVLATISVDPVGAWRSGDRAVIAQLADLELKRCGLNSPVPVPAVTPRAELPDRRTRDGSA